MSKHQMEFEQFLYRSGQKQAGKMTLFGIQQIAKQMETILSMWKRQTIKIQPVFTMSTFTMFRTMGNWQALAEQRQMFMLENDQKI